MQAQTSSQIYPPSPPSLPYLRVYQAKALGRPTYHRTDRSHHPHPLDAMPNPLLQRAVKELLGWRDEDLIDTEFLDLVNGAWMRPVWSLLLCHSPPGCSSSVDDRENFKKNFEQSIRDNSDMQSYVRMQAKPEAPSPPSSTSTSEPAKGTEVLFEINGYPHFIEGDDSCKCFFATAKTYPSRNTAM
jgi:hypothetical protein